VSTAWANGSTRAWRLVRSAVLARDSYLCRAHTDGWCAKANRATSHECTELADQAHHTRGKAFGDDPAHIVAACKTCNLHIGNPAETVDPQPEPRTRW
jgi:hypothetical protein